jgi:hypothetical protein
MIVQLEHLIVPNYGGGHLALPTIIRLARKKFLGQTFQLILKKHQRRRKKSFIALAHAVNVIQRLS